MSIKSRVDKVEGAFKLLDKSNYNTVIIVEQSDSPGIWEIIKLGERVYRGTMDEIEVYLNPYRTGGSTIIWDDIHKYDEGIDEK